MAGDDWRHCTVGDITAPMRNALVGGPFGSNLITSDYVRHGVPVIRGQNMGRGRWVDGEFVFVGSEKANALSANLARAGDLVFTQRGTLGQVALVPEKLFERYLISQSQMKLTVDPGKADAIFLYYVFQSREQQDYIKRNAIQTGVPHTNLGILRDTPLLLPPLIQQRSIACILGTLDDKIELNRRMNETLESMARALFKSWFVDFEPVRAKAEGRDTALPREIADLFPDRFQNSELGEVPKGWQACTWGDLVTLEYGRSLREYTTQDGAYPVYGTNGRIGAHSEPLCRHPGIIIGRKGAYRGVRFCNSPFFVIDTAFSVEPKVPLELRWAFYEIRRQDINSIDSGSAIPSTSRGDFYSLPVTAPPFEIQKCFVEILNPSWVRQEHNERECVTLGAMRDALLPKLLSGEIRVKDAENVVEDAV